MSNKAKKDEDEEEDEDKKPEEGEEGAEGEGGEGGEEGASKFDAKKIILFVVAPIVVLAAVGGGLYFTGMLDGLLGKDGEEGGEHAAAEGEHGGAVDEHGNPIVGGAFLEIPTMIVNLNSPDGNPRYLRLSVQLELQNAGDKTAVEAVIPRVVDQFQTYLRELRVKDLRGSAGIYRLQMELLWRVNQAAAPIEVKDVLFQEILIQ
jgi:flagellar FliL protein